MYTRVRTALTLTTTRVRWQRTQTAPGVSARRAQSTPPARRDVQKQWQNDDSAAQPGRLQPPASPVALCRHRPPGDLPAVSAPPPWLPRPLPCATPLVHELTQPTAPLSLFFRPSSPAPAFLGFFEPVIRCVPTPALRPFLCSQRVGDYAAPRLNCRVPWTRLAHPLLRAC